MCPNTTALSIKENGKRFADADEVRANLKAHGIGKPELWLFYLIFDLPSMVSNRYFEKSLKSLRESVRDLST
jgi:hypothetical protein